MEEFALPLQGTTTLPPQVMAQLRYCRSREMPMFLPTSGICYRCQQNVFSGRSGYTIEDAGKRLLTGCPHCNASWTD